ncbi:MAG: 50S ribosomal protein L14e [Candidatus Woesearchaeota archaeon]
MMEVGRLCVKIAGRDTGKQCVIVDVLDDKFVLIDGETRRRKCNMKHLEPKADVLPLKKGAAHSDVVAEFKKRGIEIKEKKPREAKPKMRQVRSFDRKKMMPKETVKKPKAQPAVKAAPAGEKPVAAQTKLEKTLDDESEQ